MERIYFEIPIGKECDGIVKDFLGLCQRKYKTTELEVICSFEMNGNIRHVCLPVNAPYDTKVKEAGFYEVVYRDFKFTSPYFNK